MAEKATKPEPRPHPEPDDVPELTMEQAVDGVAATQQRLIGEGADLIRQGLAKWGEVEAKTRWLGELPGLLKSHASQIGESVKTVTEASESATKKLKGELMPPIEIIRQPSKAVGE